MIRTILSLVFFIFTCFGYAQEFSRRVLGVSDGDTFTLLTPEKEQVLLRTIDLYEVIKVEHKSVLRELK